MQQYKANNKGEHSRSTCSTASQVTLLLMTTLAPWSSGIVRVYQDSYAIFCAVVIGATLKMYAQDAAKIHIAVNGPIPVDKLGWAVFTVAGLTTFYLMSAWGGSALRVQIGLSTYTAYLMRQCTEVRVVYLSIACHVLYCALDFFCCGGDKETGADQGQKCHEKKQE